MKKNLKDIQLVPTEHPESMKRVLLAKENSQTNISQIAIFEMKAGESSAQHRHWGIEEFLLVLEGEAEISVDSETQVFQPNDFVTVNFALNHSLRAITHCKILSVGCKVNQ